MPETPIFIMDSPVDIDRFDPDNIRMLFDRDTIRMYMEKFTGEGSGDQFREQTRIQGQVTFTVDQAGGGTVNFLFKGGGESL